jgi:hypothetical protein
MKSMSRAGGRGEIITMTADGNFNRHRNSHLTKLSKECVCIQFLYENMDGVMEMVAMFMSES